MVPSPTAAVDKQRRSSANALETEAEYCIIVFISDSLPFLFRRVTNPSHKNGISKGGTDYSRHSRVGRTNRSRAGSRFSSGLSTIVCLLKKRLSC